MHAISYAISFTISSPLVSSSVSFILLPFFFFFFTAGGGESVVQQKCAAVQIAAQHSGKCSQTSPSSIPRELTSTIDLSMRSFKQSMFTSLYTYVSLNLQKNLKKRINKIPQASDVLQYLQPGAALDPPPRGVTLYLGTYASRAAAARAYDRWGNYDVFLVPYLFNCFYIRAGQIGSTFCR